MQDTRNEENSFQNKQIFLQKEKVSDQSMDAHLQMKLHNFEVNSQEQSEIFKYLNFSQDEVIHNNEDNFVSSPTKKGNLIIYQNGQKYYKCQYCKVEFQKGQELGGHCQKVHTFVRNKKVK